MVEDINKQVFKSKSRWDWLIAGFLALLLILWMSQFVFDNPRWKWDEIGHYLFDARILSGLYRTIGLTIISGFTGLVAGVVVAYLRLANNPVLNAVGAIFIWIIRAVPPLVLLLLIFFLGALVPEIPIGMPYLDPIFSIDTNTAISTKFAAAIIGLTLYQAAYIGEIYRGGFSSISPGQHEAATALGMGTLIKMRRIISPQLIRVIIPPLSNELITLFKNTSLAFVIGYTELLTSAQLIYSVNYKTIPLLTVVSIWYLVLTSLAMFGQRQLERRFSRGFDGKPAKKSIKRLGSHA